MSDKQKSLVIAAAGTGGHVMPALAVARVLRARGWKVRWIGTKAGMEGGIVKRDGIEFTALDFRGVRGRGLWGMVTGTVKLMRSSLQCWGMLRRSRPDVFFTTGGYVAVPVAWGARKTGVRTVVMNCDAGLLLSTRMILRQCWAVACGFAGSARSYAGEFGRITGIPVRADITAVPPPEERLAGREGRLRLFVFGGSLGARVLNQTVPAMLALFPEESRPEVFHQCGRGHLEETKAAYAENGVRAEVAEFVDDMAGRYAWSDLVICRAGATSAAEICAAGAAALLVPFVAKTTSHQIENAKLLAGSGAALWVEQGKLTPEHLFGMLARLDRPKLLAMAQKARGLSRAQAAEAVAELIEAVGQMKRRGPLPETKLSA